MKTIAQHMEPNGNALSGNDIVVRAALQHNKSGAEPVRFLTVNQYNDHNDNIGKCSSAHFY